MYQRKPKTVPVNVDVPRRLLKKIAALAAHFGVATEGEVFVRLLEKPAYGVRVLDTGRGAALDANPHRKIPERVRRQIMERCVSGGWTDAELAARHRITRDGIYYIVREQSAIHRGVSSCKREPAWHIKRCARLWRCEALSEVGSVAELCRRMRSAGSQIAYALSLGVHPDRFRKLLVALKVKTDPRCGNQCRCAETLTLTCANQACRRRFQRLASNVRHGLKRGQRRFFCQKSCQKGARKK